jgi:cell division control protein 6
LVILDEIDHLLATSTSSDSLSRLFATALLPSSNLVLVGIANALDLTQRHLNILADAQEDEDEPLADPELLHSRPFQSDEMVAIVKARLSTLHASSENAATLPLPIVMPAALELAAKKVAAVTGDLRSFLSLIRKAVEIFEGEQRKRFATANVEESPTSKRKVSPSSSRKAGQEDSLAQFDAVTAPKLTPAHILKATRLVSLTSASGSGPSGSFGSSSQPGATLSAVSSTSLIEAKISDLNLHQRLVLTSFLVSTLQKQARVLAWSSGSRPSEAMKPGELHSAYRSLLEKDDVLHAVGSNEFSDLVSGLHTRGLVGFEREYSKASSPPSATLAPPMMRRSSSSSSTSSRGGRGSRSPSPSATQAPLVLLYGTTELAAAIRAAKPAEAAAICNTILNREEKRIRRLKAYKEQEEAERNERINAPREGFNGDGLDDLDAKFVGKRDKRGRAGDQDDEEDLEGQAGQDDGPTAEGDSF